MPNPEEWGYLTSRTEFGRTGHYLHGECLVEGERLDVTMPAGRVARGVYARDGLGWDGPCLVSDTPRSLGVLRVTPIAADALCRRSHAGPE